MPLVRTDDAGPHLPGELVVSLAHRDLVLAEFRELGVQEQELVQKDRSPGLELALLEILDVERVADRLDPQPPGQLHAERATARILEVFRAHCQAQFGGWTPMVSKNQAGEGVHGTPDIGIGGVDPASVRPPRPAELPPAPVTLETETVRVAILDTGVYWHGDLDGAALADDPSAILELGEAPLFISGHGTFVAGIIIRRAPNSRLSIRSVLDESCTASVWDVANAVAACAQRGIGILNLSFCCFSADGEAPFALARALQRLDPDIVVVAAAGNHGDIDTRPNGLSSVSPAWPGAFDRVVAVGANGIDGQPTSFSPRLPWVRLQAPGEDVVSTYFDGLVNCPGASVEPPLLPFCGYASWTGTSFAAAAVSGAIARRVVPGATPREALEEVLNLPEGNAEGIWAHRYQ